MCEFVSWAEYKGEIFFLTNKEMKSRRGKELITHTVDKSDLVGHGAILWFYGLDRNTTTQHECEDFSSPDNFPPRIVDAIKSGQMSFFNVCPKQLLTDEALAKYEKIGGPAWAEYEKIKDQAWAEYEKIRGPAWAEYEKIEDQAWAEYEKIRGPAWAEYKKIKDPAWAEYKKIEGQTFWRLFSDKNNRAAAWK